MLGSVPYEPHEASVTKGLCSFPIHLALWKGSVHESSVQWRDVRRRRKKEKDEAQSSLDAFVSPHQDEPTAPEPEPFVPPMHDLDLLEEAEAQLSAPTPETTSAELESSPRRFRMPSSESFSHSTPPTSAMKFHDLGLLYPNAPVPSHDGGMVMHNATLVDLTGCHQLMDWVAEGHACIVDMKRIIKRPTEFNQAISWLQTFIEGDLQGQIIKMTETRIMLLPEGCRGLRGTDMESFAIPRDEFTGVD